MAAPTKHFAGVERAEHASRRDKATHTLAAQKASSVCVFRGVQSCL